MNAAPRIVLVWALVTLAGCQFGGSREAASPLKDSADEITVTTLDPPSAATGAGTAKPVEESAASPLTSAQSDDASRAEPADIEAEGTPEPVPALPINLEKPPIQVACEKGGGSWATAGTAGSMACISPTRDGGEQCTRETDCEGLCLARSGSCAPVKPMFGCNEILQADGRRVTLCID